MNLIYRKRKIVLYKIIPILQKKIYIICIVVKIANNSN